jgi:hypothetical protein
MNRGREKVMKELGSLVLSAVNEESKKRIRKR